VFVTLNLGCNSPRRTTAPAMRDLGGEVDLVTGIDLGVIVPIDMGGGGCTIDSECTATIPCLRGLCTVTGCSFVPDDALCGGGEICNPSTGCETSADCTVPADCADTNPCTVAERCTDGTCRSDVLDGDGDGFPSTICGGSDCDDSRATIAPGRPESCNGRDDNCSGIADEGSGASLCGGTMVCTGGVCRATEICGELNASCCAGGTCNDSTLACTSGRCAARECAAPLAPIPFGAGAHCSVATRTCVEDCGSDSACFTSCLGRDTTPANPTSGLTCNQCVNYSANQCIDSGGCHSEFAAWICCGEDLCSGAPCSACDSLRAALVACADSVTCTGVAVGCFP